MEGIKHNLPWRPTSFVGREDEIAAIAGLLRQPRCRLLTLMGPGGVGKTRLALEVAQRFLDPASETAAADAYRDGVFLVALQPVAAPEDIVTAVAGAIGFNFPWSQEDARTQLVRYLAQRRCLLILDNYEHLLPATDLILELLNEAPGVGLMVTSRTALSLSQEWLFPLEGMSFPVGEAAGSLKGYGALRLFLERARQVRHDFSLEDEGTDAIQICQLMDGLPLGIEMAASWLRRLPGDEIAVEIRRGLDILESDLGDLPDRHRSMRLVFNYSWQLLGQDERKALMKLSVFRGGFRREAAVEVAGASLKTLSALLDHSMVRLTEGGRYEIHELQRQFAAEKLADDPELETAVRDRHGDYYTALMDHPVIRLLGGQSRQTAKVLLADIDNVRSAWDWAVAQSRVRQLDRLVEAVYWVSWLRAWPQDARRVLQGAVECLRAAETGRGRDIALAKALCFLGRLDDLDGRALLARERIQESMTLLRRHDARRELAQAMMFAAIAAVNARDNPNEAEAIALESVDLLNETGQHGYRCEVYHYLGYLAQTRGRYDECEHWYQEALLLAQRIGDQKALALGRTSLGIRAYLLGEYEEARRLIGEGLAIARDQDLGPAAVLPLIVLGQTAATTGRVQQATSYLQEATEIAQEWGQRIRIAMCQVSLASLSADQGDYEDAAELYRAVLETIRESSDSYLRLRALSGLGRIALDMRAYDRARRYYEESLELSLQAHARPEVSSNQAALGRLALAQGDCVLAGRNFRDALREALAVGAPPPVLDILSHAGALLSLKGDPALAARLAALILRHPASYARTKVRAERLLQRAEAKLPEDVFAAACQRGAQVEVEPTAKMVVAQLELLAGHRAPAGAHAANQPHLDPLSQRELEVLQLVALGRSNREIAAELFLALGTVKSHMHHIFQKLGVSNRMEAVTRARALRLL